LVVLIAFLIYLSPNIAKKNGGVKYFSFRWNGKKHEYLIHTETNLDRLSAYKAKIARDQKVANEKRVVEKESKSHKFETKYANAVVGMRVQNYKKMNLLLRGFVQGKWEGRVIAVNNDTISVEVTNCPPAAGDYGDAYFRGQHIVRTRSDTVYDSSGTRIVDW